MTAGGLHHVEINVRDLARSVDFWGWLLPRLGYAPFQEWREGWSWILGTTYVVLVQAPREHVDAGYHRQRVGLNHLAFHAASRDDVELLTTELRKRGVPILYPERHPHAGGLESYAVFFEDPDRIKVEVVAP